MGLIHVGREDQSFLLMFFNTTPRFSDRVPCILGRMTGARVAICPRNQYGKHDLSEDRALGLYLR